MKNAQRRRETAIALNGTAALSSLLGLIDNAQSAGGFGSVSSLLFYTIQSNIWMLLVCALFVCYDVFRLKKESWFYVVKFMFTSSILIAFIMYCTLIAPEKVRLEGAAYLFKFNNLTLHIISPLLALASFLLTDVEFDRSNKGVALTAVVMPLYYLAFSMVVAAISPQPLFGDAQTGVSRFPYFFLDYQTHGWFTWAADIQELGAFWWLLIMTGTVLALGYGLIKLADFVQRGAGESAA